MPCSGMIVQRKECGRKNDRAISDPYVYLLAHTMQCQTPRKQGRTKEAQGVVNAGPSISMQHRYYHMHNEDAVFNCDRYARR